jgi:hypothetical protein
MKRVAFYSWQSDLPNSTNRGFIEKALENAVKQIRDDNSVKVEPVIDRDTSGVPGSPDIASTILAKIEQAHIFVCDVSIISQDKLSRPTPNPNVLIELGYAMKALGPQQIIMVMNSAFGDPELLPFDLRMKRVLTYRAADGDENRASERRQLEAKLEQGLRTILLELDKFLIAEAVEPSSVSNQAIRAVENSEPNQLILVRKFMSWFIDELDKVAPPFPATAAEIEPDELLIQAINQTEGLVAEFARLASAIAITNKLELILAIYKNFDHFLNNYLPPRGFSGSYTTIRFDFYKFLGHELFISLLALLIRENKWEFITALLEEGLYVENTSSGTPRIVAVTDISDYIQVLQYRSQRLELNRVSVRADMLNERHTKGELAKIVPMRQFIDADYFLLLRHGLEWRPWSTIYLENQVPRFLLEASRTKYAEQLLRPLSIEDISAFRVRVAESKSMLRQMFTRSLWFSPLEYFNPNTIGSQ